jgi:hypothetical protein
MFCIMLKVKNNLKWTKNTNCMLSKEVLLVCGFCVLALPLMYRCCAVQIFVWLLV